MPISWPAVISAVQTTILMTFQLEMVEIEQDEGIREKKMEETETCKENIFLIHTRKRMKMEFVSNPYLAFVFQN